MNTTPMAPASETATQSKFWMKAWIITECVVVVAASFIVTKWALSEINAE